MEWILGNGVEILGAVLGIVYIFFSIRRSIWTWPVGLLTSAIYVWVFFVSKLYADMGLQIYYVGISIYGWSQWLRKDEPDSSGFVGVSRLTFKTGLILFAINLVIFVLSWYILKNYTDSPVPAADSLATSLSIVATWMLARKILEHWLVWIFVDAFSMGLFLYKGLFPTVILFGVYTVMAVLGYFEWRKACLGNGVKVDD